MKVEYSIWYTQFIAIIVATILLYIHTRRHSDLVSEKKYLLPYLIIDSLAMILFAIDTYVIHKIPTFFVTFIFTGFEIVLVPLYIAHIIGQKIRLILPVSILLISQFISMIVFKHLTTFTYLAVNLYISYYIFKYWIWILKYQTEENKTKSFHFDVIQGFSICFLGSVPFFIGSLIANLLTDESYRVFFDQFEYVGYCLLNIFVFVFIIKATIWRMRSKSFAGQ